MDLDGNAVNTALDYILLNFRILKAAVDPPVCVCGVVWCVVCGVWSGLHCHVPRRPDVPSLFFLPFSFFPPGNSSPVTLHCHVPRRPHLPVGWSNGFFFPLPFFLFSPQVPPPLSEYIATSPEGLTAQLAGVTAFVYYLTTPPNVLGGMFPKTLKC